MATRIKVTPERDPDRIEGFCVIPTWPMEQSVIAFSRRGTQWTVASSMALPSQLDQAKVIKECFDQAFAELARVQHGNREA